MTVPFMYNFRSLSNKFPTIFYSLIFPHFTAQVTLFFVQKKKPKIFVVKTVIVMR